MDDQVSQHDKKLLTEISIKSVDILHCLDKFESSKKRNAAMSSTLCAFLVKGVYDRSDRAHIVADLLSDLITNDHINGMEIRKP